MLLFPGEDACHILAGISCTRARPTNLASLGRRFTTRTSLRSGDKWDHTIALSIAPCTRSRFVRHAKHHAPLIRISCREIPSDVTRTQNLRGLPCKPAERVVPGTHSRRSANRTRGVQHVIPRTSARMGTCAFRIHTTFLLTVHMPVSYHARDVSAPASDRANVRAWAVRKTRNGPRTQCPAEPAQSPK